MPPVENKCAPHSDFVAVPRWVFDEVLPLNELPAPFLRVVLFLVRKTLGWQKREDFISLTQIERGACVVRRDARAALVFWAEVGVVEVLPVGKRRMNLIRLTDIAGDEIKKRICTWLSDRRADRLVSVGD
jgi:hypothetical protein